MNERTTSCVPLKIKYSSPLETGPAKAPHFTATCTVTGRSGRHRHPRSRTSWLIHRERKKKKKIERR